MSYKNPPDQCFCFIYTLKFLFIPPKNQKDQSGANQKLRKDSIFDASLSLSLNSCNNAGGQIKSVPGYKLFSILWSSVELGIRFIWFSLSQDSIVQGRGKPKSDLYLLFQVNKISFEMYIYQVKFIQVLPNSTPSWIFS